MLELSQLAHHTALLAGVSTLLYALTVTLAALTAILARTPQRRRAARDVLTLLLHRR